MGEVDLVTTHLKISDTGPLAVSACYVSIVLVVQAIGFNCQCVRGLWMDARSGVAVAGYAWRGIQADRLARVARASRDAVSR